jgi:hypothetical protein
LARLLLFSLLQFFDNLRKIFIKVMNLLQHIRL